ncbi:MAG: DUF599 family protein, partial [Candidatus Micrarchaeota archaeon]
MATTLPLNFAFDEHFVAFVIFIICYGLVYIIGRTNIVKRGKTSKNIRELYRSSFVEGLLLEKGNMQPLQQLLQNNIAITNATLTGVIIMSGLLFDQIVSFESGIDLARSVAMLILLGHALLSLLAQIRTMMYIPVVFGTDSKLIKEHQGIAKHEYLTRLFSSSYMLFSNAMRDIFYLFALFLWTVSAYMFMLLVFVITFIIIREETEKRARITVF